MDDRFIGTRILWIVDRRLWKRHPEYRPLIDWLETHSKRGTPSAEGAKELGITQPEFEERLGKLAKASSDEIKVVVGDRGRIYRMLGENLSVVRGVHPDLFDWIVMHLLANESFEVEQFYEQMPGEHTPESFLMCSVKIMQMLLQKLVGESYR